MNEDPSTEQMKNEIQNLKTEFKKIKVELANMKSDIDEKFYNIVERTNQFEIKTMEMAKKKSMFLILCLIKLIKRRTSCFES